MRILTRAPSSRVLRLLDHFVLKVLALKCEVWLSSSGGDTPKPLSCPWLTLKWMCACIRCTLYGIAHRDRRCPNSTPRDRPSLLRGLVFLCRVATVSYRSLLRF